MSANVIVPVLFQQLAGHIAAADPSVRSLQAVYRFVLGVSGDWIVDLARNPGVRAYAGEGEVVDCTVHCSGDTFVAMAKGEVSPQLAFLRREVRVEGDMTAALRLVELFAALQRQSARMQAH